jgi:hypothetical protein
MANTSKMSSGIETAPANGQIGPDKINIFEIIYFTLITCVLQAISYVINKIFLHRLPMYMNTLLFSFLTHL